MFAYDALAQLDVNSIIQRSVEATERDWAAAPKYDYFERDQGDHTAKTCKVMMIEGSPYNQLIAVNDQPLPADQRKKEEERLKRTLAQRRNETPEQRAQRIAKYEKERDRDHLLLQQMPKAFDFRMIGRGMLGPHEVYILSASARARYHPPNARARVLTGMKGNLWIDQKSFHWVKVEAQVVHPVSIEGFLARVEPGTLFELEKMPVDDGIWLGKHFAMKANTKVLMLFGHHTQERETYWGYTKARAPETSPVSQR